jgi:hypothetical protein
VMILAVIVRCNFSETFLGKRLTPNTKMLIFIKIKKGEYEKVIYCDY